MSDRAKTILKTQKDSHLRKIIREQYFILKDMCIRLTDAQMHALCQMKRETDIMRYLHDIKFA